MLKEKVLFLIALTLVLAGVTYLGITIYRFINSTSQNQEQSQQVVDSTLNDFEGVELVGSSNKELLGDSFKKGDVVKIGITLKNTSNESKNFNLEGRVYKVNELFSFPNIDTDLPVNVESISVALEPNETKEFNYEYTITECGNFYMALANNDFWESGRGLVSYGYFTVSCDQAEESSSTDFASSDFSNSSVTKGGLTLYDQKKQELQKSKVLGASTTKGGVNVSNVRQLPKSGSKDNILIILGVLLISLGVYQFKTTKD